MSEFDRLNGCIEWIDVSVVERERTPEWAIQWCIMLPSLSSQVGLWKQTLIFLYIIYCI